MSSPKPNNGLLSPAPSTSPNGSGVTSPSSAKQLSVRTGSTESGNGVASASGQNGSQDLATNREQLQAKWDKQFDEIIDALAEARARYPQAEKEVEKLSDDQSKVQRLLQIMDLKNLALEGFDAKLKKATAQLEESREQLTLTNKLYFQSLVLNVKMHKLYASSTPAKNVDSSAVYDQCIAQNIPISQWPNFVNTNFS